MTIIKDEFIFLRCDIQSNIFICSAKENVRFSSLGHSFLFPVGQVLLAVILGNLDEN